MMIPTLLAMRDFSRMREIITVLTKYGLGSFVQRIRLGAAGGDEVHPDSRYMSTPRRFRKAFEELGPTFVKLGQVLSTRVDIFGAEWIEEFEQLQSNVAPIPSSEIYTLVEAYLGKPVSEVFRSIDPKPAGSASVAQVHRAELLDGTAVAVKVKRPDIEPVIQADLRILNHLARLMESEIPEVRRYQPVLMVAYFAKSLAKETDLSVELRYMQRFGQTFSDDPLVRIPAVYPDISNRHILVQDYIGGTLLKDADLETMPHTLRSGLAGRITDTLFTMMLRQGFFHADPHPGNIFINDNGGITFIDFGLVGHLGNTRRREILNLINALTNNDALLIQYVLSDWAQGDLPDENLLGADVLEMLLNYEHTPIRDLRVSQVINDITSIMRRHGLTLPGDLVMLFKTLITLEGVVKRLDGSIELLERAKPITEAAVKEQASAAHIARNAKTQLRTLLQMAESLPQDFFRLTRMLQKGKFGITLDLKQSDRISHQIDSAANRLTMGIVTAALIIGSSIVMSIDTGPKFIGFVGYLIAFANSLWIIWSVWRSGKH